MFLAVAILVEAAVICLSIVCLMGESMLDLKGTRSPVVAPIVFTAGTVIAGLLVYLQFWT